MTDEIIHATAVAINGHGILLLGPSGSGKSDLAIRLIDRGARLISDDAVVVSSPDATPILKAAPNIEGLIEVRGVGICTIEAVSSAPLRMAIELASEIERMPKENLTTKVAGFDVPLVKFRAFESSSAIKIEYALRTVVDGGRWPVARIVTDKAESHQI